MPEVIRMRWYEIDRAIESIVEQLDGRTFKSIVAVLRGGLVPARIMASRLEVENLVVWDGKEGVLGELVYPALIVDDIVDTGQTAVRAKLKFAGPVAAIVSKSSEADYRGVDMEFGDPRWIQFPWESAFDEVGARQNGRY